MIAKGKISFILICSLSIFLFSSPLFSGYISALPFVIRIGTTSVPLDNSYPMQQAVASQGNDDGEKGGKGTGDNDADTGRTKTLFGSTFLDPTLATKKTPTPTVTPTPTPTTTPTPPPCDPESEEGCPIDDFVTPTPVPTTPPTPRPAGPDIGVTGPEVGELKLADPGTGGDSSGGIIFKECPKTGPIPPDCTRDPFKTPEPTSTLPTLLKPGENPNEAPTPTQTFPGGDVVAPQAGLAAERAPTPSPTPPPFAGIPIPCDRLPNLPACAKPSPSPLPSPFPSPFTPPIPTPTPTPTQTFPGGDVVAPQAGLAVNPDTGGDSSGGIIFKECPKTGPIPPDCTRDPFKTPQPTSTLPTLMVPGELTSDTGGGGSKPPIFGNDANVLQGRGVADPGSTQGPSEPQANTQGTGNVGKLLQADPGQNPPSGNDNGGDDDNNNQGQGGSGGGGKGQVDRGSPAKSDPGGNTGDGGGSGDADPIS